MEGAVGPTQILAVAGLSTILLTGIDAPVMAVGRPGALAIFNMAMLVGTGAVAWFTAPLGITAVAVGIAIGQLVLLLAGQFFLLRRLVGIPMRESLGSVPPRSRAQGSCPRHPAGGRPSPGSRSSRCR